jgi:type I restriction enzyme S subunit
MKTTLKPYPAMKDSGVPWLGEVPEHWEVRRMRNAAEMRVSNVDKHTKEDEQPVRLCNYVDVYKNDRIRAGMPFMRATATVDEIERFRLRTGDVLITKDSEAWNDIGVPALVEETADDLICGYHLALLRPFAESVEGGYIFRALQSTGVAYQFHVEANGVTRYGLSHSAIKSTWLPLPPLPEQAAIVRFLDHADRRIRRYIGAKQKLIKLLEEQKQAIIHRAVTRGLDPNVRLKPSGVERLGDVPEHWEVKKLRLLFRYAKGRRAAELTNEYIGRHPGSFPVYSGQTESDGLMGHVEWYEFDFIDPVVFVTTVGARAMSTRLVSGQFSLSQNCALIVPRIRSTNSTLAAPCSSGG